MGKMATREAYGLALAEFGAKYDLIVLDADLSKSTKTDTFKKEFPERTRGSIVIDIDNCIFCGLCEKKCPHCIIKLIDINQEVVTSEH